MSTQAYERIQAKLNFSGREYFEGMSAADFAGLTDDELADVRKTLQMRSRQGDGVSLDALRCIMSREDFVAFAEGLLLAIKVTGLFAAQLAAVIFEESPSDSAWRRLLSALRQADLPGRRWALNKISPDSMSEEMKAQLIEVLAALVLKESDSSLLLSESVSLLLAKGFTPRSEEIAEYAKRLQSPHTNERLAVLTELGCTPSGG